MFRRLMLYIFPFHRKIHAAAPFVTLSPTDLCRDGDVTVLDLKRKYSRLSQI